MVYAVLYMYNRIMLLFCTMHAKFFKYHLMISKNTIYLPNLIFAHTQIINLLLHLNLFRLDLTSKCCLQCYIYIHIIYLVMLFINGKINFSSQTSRFRDFFSFISYKIVRTLFTGILSNNLAIQDFANSSVFWWITKLSKFFYFKILILQNPFWGHVMWGRFWCLLDKKRKAKNIQTDS